MQQLRSHGWVAFLQRVTLFCNKYDIQVLVVEDNYVPYGRSKCFVANQTNDDYFRREVYMLAPLIKLAKNLILKLNEVNMELLSCMGVLSPANSFASFDPAKVCRSFQFVCFFLILIWPNDFHKVLRLVEFYPNDMIINGMLRLGNAI
jgi:hypothetical protein